MSIDLAQYYDRFDAADNFDRHLFRAEMPLQSAELNELQSSSHDRLKRIADVLFDDGAVLSGAECVVNPETGACRCGGGALYLRGAARGVIPREFTIPVLGMVSVGVYMRQTVVTETTDARLRDPAVSAKNFQEPGAGRLKIELTWGVSTEGLPGEFFEVHRIEDGYLLSRSPPPQIDAVSLAIARYDRQSSGGMYVSNGLQVTRLADLDGKQVYSMASGVARVSGNEIVREHARRIEHAAVPDTRTVTLEPHGAAGGTERVTTRHGPIVTIFGVAIQREETVTLTHGAVAGAQDLLPKSPVVQIISVVQGETTYAPAESYNLTADRVDWSPPGPEPGPGTTYTVTYRYMQDVTPANVDQTGFDVTGAVPGTLIQVTYSWAMPRFDRICLNAAGDPVVIKGVAARVRPRAPDVPAGLLGIALIDQRWTSATRLVNNAVRMVPMNELNAVNRRIDTLFALVAEERLAHNLTANDPTAKKGVFVDPFYDDDLRDQGIAQTAAIANEVMTLGVEVSVHSQSLPTVQMLDARVIVEDNVTVGPDEVVIDQPLRTGCMLINPYDSFSPMPGVATIAPAVDFWTDVQTEWLSPDTRTFNEDAWTNESEMIRWTQYWRDNGSVNSRYSWEQWLQMHTVVTSSETIRRTEIERVGENYVDLQFLRQIPVRFTLTGFGNGEILEEVRFDGRSVAFEEVTT